MSKLLGSIVAFALLGSACATDDNIGAIELNLVGQTPSGNMYILRNGTINVDGGTTHLVFQTEDDPNATSLHGVVPIGSYTATLADGWELHRIASGVESPVAASLVSSNPSSFEISNGSQVNVPLRFEVDGESLSLGTGDFDVTVGVQELVGIGNRQPFGSRGLTAGFLVAVPIDIPVAVTLRRLAHFSLPTTNPVEYQIGLYGSDAGEPAVLVMDLGAPRVEVAGKNEIDVGPVSLAPGRYWVAAVYSTQNGESAGVGIDFTHPDATSRFIQWATSSRPFGTPLPPTWPTAEQEIGTGFELNQYIVVTQR